MNMKNSLKEMGGKEDPHWFFGFKILCKSLCDVLEYLLSAVVVWSGYVLIQLWMTVEYVVPVLSYYSESYYQPLLETDPIDRNLLDLKWRPPVNWDLNLLAWSQLTTLGIRWLMAFTWDWPKWVSVNWDRRSIMTVTALRVRNEMVKHVWIQLCVM